METMVALLRGINVGGRSRLAMAELRAVATGCGFEDVRTYIQSGNVVLRAPGQVPAEVAHRLRNALAERLARDVAVIVRTGDELAGVVESSPFLPRGADPAHLHVVFVAGDEPAVVPLDDLDAYAPEEAVALGRELHLWLPGGMGRSALATDLARRPGPVATTRNWRTVTRLAAMAAGTG
jgi:uncharacterized protein (DUF1697 family)